MTAEECYKKYTKVNINHKDIKEAMIEFAKYHVKQALKQALKEASIIDESIGGGLNIEVKSIDKDSVLNAYPLENIK